MSASINTHDDCGIEEEIEALKSIYVEELEVKHDVRGEYPTVIHLNLHPATAGNAKEQYVRLTLIVKIPRTYPNSLPLFEIRNPRGLSDEDIDAVVQDLRTKATRSRGSAMLYELIELAKEHLTVGNTPRCSCVICLYGFSAEDAFIRTECYHYFHSHCLRRYIEYIIAESETVARNSSCEDGGCNDSDAVEVHCPVCREAMTYDLNALKSPPPIHVESAADFSIGVELVRLQKQMAERFSIQKSRGGIIDVEAEKNKFLLEISTVPAESSRRTARGSTRSHLGVGSEHGKRWKKPQSEDVTGRSRNIGDCSGGNAEARETNRGDGESSSERGNKCHRGGGGGGRKWGRNRFGHRTIGVGDNGGSSENREGVFAQVLMSEVNRVPINVRRDGVVANGGRFDRGSGSLSRGRSGRTQNGYRKRTERSERDAARSEREQNSVENIDDKRASKFHEPNKKWANNESNGFRDECATGGVGDRGKGTGAVTNSYRYRGRSSKTSAGFCEKSELPSSASISNKVRADLESNSAALVQLHERMVLTGPPCKSFSGSLCKPPPGFGPKTSAPPGFE